MEELNRRGRPAANRPVEVEAAGAILLDDRGRICVVHRPRYDDWSLPKGKLEDRETHRDAARREVQEETGFTATFATWNADVRYVDDAGRHKRVRYFEMSVHSGAFEPNKEVDGLDFLDPAAAAGRLTHPQDAELVENWVAQRGG